MSEHLLVTLGSKQIHEVSLSSFRAIPETLCFFSHYLQLVTACAEVPVTCTEACRV